MLNYFFPSQPSLSPMIKQLRLQYYQNLSFLEKMAQDFGEMSRISQTCLYGLSFSIGLLGFFQPWCWVFSFLGFSLLSSLAYQFQRMEQRFLSLVNNLSQAEQELNTAVAANLELSKTLVSLHEGNLSIVKHIQEKQAALVRARQDWQTQDLALNQASERIEALIQHLGEFKQKTQGLAGQQTAVLDLLAEASRLLEETHLKLASPKREESMLLRDEVNRYLRANFGWDQDTCPW